MPASKPNRFEEGLKKISGTYTSLALMVLNALVLLALIEGVLALVHTHATSSQNQHMSNIGLAYAPWRMQKQLSAPFPLNSDGFRAAELSTITNNTFNVVFTGGSVCAGFGKNTGDSVADILADKLQQEGMGKARVINLCQGGANSAQELPIFWQYGLPLEPQVVVQLTGGNDVFHPTPLGDEPTVNLPYLNANLEGLWHPEQPFIRLKSLEVAKKAFRKIQPASPEPMVDSGLIAGAFQQNLTAMHRLAGPALHVVMIQPSAFYHHPLSQEERERLKPLAAIHHHTISQTEVITTERYDALLGVAQKLPDSVYVDATRAFSNTSSTIYIDSVHFEGPGPNLVLAEILWPKLKPQLTKRYREWEKKNK